MKSLKSLAAALSLGVALPGLGVLPAVAQQGAQLNYEGADLAAVARDVALRTGRVFVIDPRVSGRVNIITPPGAGLSAQEVWEIFLATLQVNGFAAVPIGDEEYKIVPAGQAVRDGGRVGSARGTTVTRVVPLNNVQASTAAANLRGLISENGLVNPIQESNSLIIVDTQSNIQRLLDVVAQIDVDDTIVRRIPLQNAAAADVQNTLQAILSQRSNAGGQISAVAVDSSNSIVLRGSPEEVRRLAPVVRELDQAGVGQVALDTVYLNHADGAQIVEILQQLIDGEALVRGPEAEAAAAGGGGQARRRGTTVAFHRPTNALIINAPPETQRLIRGIVSRLDIRRPQVLIEAVVVEVSDNTARELGVQYLSGGGNVPLSAASFTGTQPNLVTAAGAALFLNQEPDRESIVTINTDGTRTVQEREIFDTNDPSVQLAGQLVQAAVGELLNFNGFLAGFGGEIGNDGAVYGVLLSALQSDGSSNILNVPSVLLLDNEVARLQVGQEIPIVTGEAVGTDFQGGFRQIQREDVGNILEVVPTINAGNTVQLKIRLELSSIGAFSSFSDSIITNKSVIETVALAEDGQTLVLGGLIDSTRQDFQSKVPFLGDIPLLGFLFRGSQRNADNSTLMVFIRPTILRDGYAADSVTARKYDYVAQQQRVRLREGEVTPIDDVMERYLGPGEGFVPSPAVRFQSPEENPGLDTMEPFGE